MEEKGIINLGKYIFLIILELFTMLLPAFTTPEEKIFHKSSPDNTKTG
jgi:hypothetical protein